MVGYWRNLDVSGAIITTVNGNTISNDAGGKASTALGINTIPTEVSDWQLSKLYIWNYHLSDIDFALASSSQYAALSTNTTSSICRACPLFSHSPGGSVSMAQCECERGYAGFQGEACSQCESGTFKTDVGNVPCDACPTGSDSVPGATVLSNCTCGAGYSGTEHQDCAICPIGTYWSVNFKKNWALSCGATKNEGCPTTQSSDFGGGVSSRVVDGNHNQEWLENHCSHTDISDPAWWMVDLGPTPIPITSLRIYGLDVAIYILATTIQCRVEFP